MKWKVLPKKSDDLVEQLLYNRNIKGAEQIENFFNPAISDYRKDLEIPGIKKSQTRIKEAIKGGEQIFIYGDYDADGICASAILYKGLVSIGSKIMPYIPHRQTEGYGISKGGLDTIHKAGGSLVITVDNGIVAINQAKYAKELGLDLIITDHHIPGKLKPDAYSIVHSVKMCGAAVAWCLVNGIIKDKLKEELLQFVALATVCDVMPLTNLNRAFVKEGLEILNKTDNPGLKALIKESGLSTGKIGSYETGFILGPRLNAAGRLESAIESLRLLCTKDLQKARKIAGLLNQINSERQKLTEKALLDAKLLVRKEKNIQVLYSKDWHEGVVGLVAGKIAEEFYIPTLAISVGETISKGSARSVKGVNIVEVIREFSDILIGVGGHPGAAGFSLLSEHVEVFKKRIEEYVLKLPEKEKILEIDALVQIEQVTKNLIADLEKFEPFGYDNPRPVFATYGAKITDIKTVGLGKHLKFKVVDPEQSRRIAGLDAIAFGMGELSAMLSEGQSIDLAYNLELNFFNGNENLQLKIKDIVVK